MSTRDDGLYLQDIVEAAAEIETYLEGHTEADFMASSMVRNAVLRQLMVIGEASVHVSSQLRALHPEVEWAKIVAFRNFVVHEYFAIEWAIIWHTVRKEVPVLVAQIEAVLSEI